MINIDGEFLLLNKYQNTPGRKNHTTVSAARLQLTPFVASGASFDPPLRVSCRGIFCGILSPYKVQKYKMLIKRFL